MLEPHYLAQHPSTTIYLGHLEELEYVSTAAATCGSDALEHQHSAYLRSTEQVLFKQAQSSSPKRKRNSCRKRVKTSGSLECKLPSCEKNQNTECQSEIYKKAMRPS